MRSSSFNQVNLILTQVNDVNQSVLSAIAEAAEQDTMEIPSLAKESVNQISSSTNIQLEMLRTIQEMQKEIKVLKENHKPSKGLTKEKTPFKGTYMTRDNTSEYCYTHGACAHPGKFCKRKRPAHKDEATFTDKMGGSTAFCQPCE